jgi:hypothetical protein
VAVVCGVVPGLPSKWSLQFYLSLIRLQMQAQVSIN